MRLDSKFARATRALAAVALVAAAGFAVEGCSSGASLTNVWRDPNYTGPKLKDVLVISILRTQGARRTTEDMLAQELVKKGLKATPSYSAFPDSVPNLDALKSYVEAQGFDGVIINRLAGKDERSYYVPPTATTVAMPTYGGWYGWYGGVYNTYYSPGYTETEQVYTVDTSVLAVGNPGKLIWSGTSELVDLNSAMDGAKKVNTLVLPKLTAAGII